MVSLDGLAGRRTARAAGARAGATRHDSSEQETQARPCPAGPDTWRHHRADIRRRPRAGRAEPHGRTRALVTTHSTSTPFTGRRHPIRGGGTRCSHLKGGSNTLEIATASGSSIETLVKDLDVLIRARYPLISVSTFEEGRFRRLMGAVANLERHKPKGLFVWSGTPGLRQVARPNTGVGEKPFPAPRTRSPVWSTSPRPRPVCSSCATSGRTSSEMGCPTRCSFA